MKIAEGVSTRTVFPVRMSEVCLSRAISCRFPRRQGQVIGSKKYFSPSNNYESLKSTPLRTQTYTQIHTQKQTLTPTHTHTHI